MHHVVLWGSNVSSNVYIPAGQTTDWPWTQWSVSPFTQCATWRVSSKDNLLKSVKDAAHLRKEFRRPTLLTRLFIR